MISIIYSKMDWQTKEYIDERFSDLEDKIDLILEALNVNQDNEEDEDYSDDQDEEESKEPTI